jgi:Membrane-associated lipoprotein involved in thiamine biosynthesis
MVASRLDGLMADKNGVVRRFFVMNTEATITIPAEHGSRLSAEQLADIAEEAVREVNRLMSPVGEDSDVVRFNNAESGTWVTVSPSTWTVVMEGLRWHRLSGGAFDPTIGPLKRLFTFDRREALVWPSDEDLKDAEARVGADKIEFEREGMLLSWKKDGMKLDLGAIAKGYGVDCAVEALRKNGVVNAVVEVGGEVRTLGQKPGQILPTPWNAGILNPRGEGTIVISNISDKAVATSGDYASYFIYQGKRYEHIIDPRKGLPLSEGVASVTVIHPESCMSADALATTLSVLGRVEAGKFLREQALGLFNKGIQVVMLIVEPDDTITRIDYAIDGQGEFTVKESDAEFLVFGGATQEDDTEVENAVDGE